MERTPPDAPIGGATRQASPTAPARPVAALGERAPERPRSGHGTDGGDIDDAVERERHPRVEALDGQRVDGHGRIEEHGLHLWLGFYENAFRVMQECYAELGRPPGAPLARWDDAFKQSSQVVLEDHHGGRWKHWPIFYPEDDRVPGVPDAGDGPFAVWYYLRRALGLLESLATSLPLSDDDRRPADPADDEARPLRDLLSRPLEKLSDRADALAHRVGMAALTAAIAVAATIESAVGEVTGPSEPLLHLLRGFIDWVRDLRARNADVEDRVRRIGQLIQIVVGCIVGVIRDGVLTRGFSAIDDHEFLDWLRRHGASAEAVSTSGDSA